MRHHLGIAEDGRAGVEGGAGRRDEIWREHEMPGGLDLAARMDHADGDFGLVGSKTGQVGLGADDREGALVDRRAVLDVVAREHHDACLNSCASRAGPSLRSALAVSSSGFFSALSSAATRPIAAAASAFATSAIG